MPFLPACPAIKPIRINSRLALGYLDTVEVWGSSPHVPTISCNYIPIDSKNQRVLVILGDLAPRECNFSSGLVCVGRRHSLSYLLWPVVKLPAERDTRVRAISRRAATVKKLGVIIWRRGLANADVIRKATSP